LFLDQICKAIAFQAEPDEFVRLEKQGEAIISAGNTDPLIFLWYGAGSGPLSRGGWFPLESSGHLWGRTNI